MESARGDSAWSRIAAQFSIADSWRSILEPELCSQSGSRAVEEYERRCLVEEVLPPRDDIFSWTRYCSPDDVKVVVVGQDPYHRPGQAHGLAFSVKRGVEIPPSLRNIFEAVRRCYPTAKLGTHGCLEGWAKEGVLLLNSTLTVKQGDPGSHSRIGWANVMRGVLRRLDAERRGLVFMLWGAHAQTMYSPSESRHLVLRFSHPSPLSRRPFAECPHFREANDYLAASGRGAVDWSLA
uniref:Uracil DNA glycosylase superfamily protein n=1 Tax=Anatid alphaherpesvirus 2 TaxID=3080522 RepID=A0AAU0K7W7_9ALPH